MLTNHGPDISALKRARNTPDSEIDVRTGMYQRFALIFLDHADELCDIQTVANAMAMVLENEQLSYKTAQTFNALQSLTRSGYASSRQVPIVEGGRRMKNYYIITDRGKKYLRSINDTEKKIREVSVR